MTFNSNNLNIDILVEDDRWNSFGFSYQDIFMESINLVLQNHKNLLKEFCDKKIGFSIVLTNDKSIQKLNKEYRGKDKPTNVLSFPMLDIFENGEASDKLEPLCEDFDEAIVLGDIVLSYETVIKESKEQKKSIKDHLTHLIIHSALHIIGYDHCDEEEAIIMESVEIAVLKQLGIDNPYIENL